jgi:hypothetical protein
MLRPLGNFRSQHVFDGQISSAVVCKLRADLVKGPRKSLKSLRVSHVTHQMSRATETAVMMEELLLPGHGGPAQMQRLLNFIGWGGPAAKDPSAIRIGVLGASQVTGSVQIQLQAMSEVA